MEMGGSDELQSDLIDSLRALGKLASGGCYAKQFERADFYDSTLNCARRVFGRRSLCVCVCVGVEMGEKVNALNSISHGNKQGLIAPMYAKNRTRFIIRRSVGVVGSTTGANHVYNKKAESRYGI